MPLVNVMVNGRAYTLGCDEGEEDHVKQLAAKVDAKVREALGMVGHNAGDTKLMLMAALLLADEQDELNRKQGTQAAADPEAERESLHLQAEEAEDMAAEMLDAAARRIEDIAARLSPA